MLTFFIILQVFVAIFMILVVLLQPGNRGGAGAALGGAGGDTVFGGRGANSLLTKITFGVAVVFMISNFTLSFMSMAPKSVLENAFSGSTAPNALSPSSLKDLPEAANPVESNEAPTTENNAKK